MTQALIGLHGIAATVTRHDHWAMGEDEAKTLANAVTELQAQYGFDLDPKTQAWINFAAVASMCYGPRVMASYAMTKRKPKMAMQDKPKEQAPSRPKSRPEAPATPAQLNEQLGGGFYAG